MPLSRSARLLYYRCALAMAWVAMCLLFAGPLISQFQASHHAQDHQVHSHQGHHTHSADRQAGHPAAHQAEPSASPPDTVLGLPPSSALSDWHNQCGYCELWQHSPSLSIALPAIANDAFVALGDTFLALHTGALFQTNYPHALTRGPPAFTNRYIKGHARTMFIVTRKSEKETGLLGFFKA